MRTYRFIENQHFAHIINCIHYLLTILQCQFNYSLSAKIKQKSNITNIICVLIANIDVTRNGSCVIFFSINFSLHLYQPRALKNETRGPRVWHAGLKRIFNCAVQLRYLIIVLWYTNIIQRLSYVLFVNMF